LSQWQKLPSELLADICKKEKRPYPKYKPLQSGDKCLYRVIVQDAKASRRGGDHDLILVPASAVANSEQAMEEAALLALLKLTPSIPHERTLPEPYKTTWLNALQAKKESGSKPKSKASSGTPIENEKKGDVKHSGTFGSSASSNLISANSFSSRSEKRTLMEDKKKDRNAKIRRHEAFRMANRDVQVFMSTQVRKQIEILLRGEADKELMNALNSENEELEESNEEDHTDDVVMVYVTRRLTHEGFTSSQSRAGYTAVLKNPSVTLKSMNTDEDEYMDKFYEESLQWLCIHLNEDQLPEGFDPRGRTLDVIVAPKSKKSLEIISTEGDDDESIIPDAINLIVQQFGTSVEEAACLCRGQEDKVEMIFWNALCQVNNIDINLFTNLMDLGMGEIECNKVLSAEEIEVLRAIFPEEEDLQVVHFTDFQNEDMIQLRIPLQSNDDENRNVCIEYHCNSYPRKHPKVLIRGGWSSNHPGLGTAIQSQLLRFVSELPSGEPMIFELYNFAQELLQDGENGMPSGSVKVGSDSILLPYLSGGSQYARSVHVVEKKQSSQIQRQSQKKSARSTFRARPRTKSFFWSKSPAQTPPAIAFPRLRSDIKKARDHLPAAAAREEFLNVMKEADRNDRVVLITGKS